MYSRHVFLCQLFLISVLSDVACSAAEPPTAGNSIPQTDGARLERGVNLLAIKASVKLPDGVTVFVENVPGPSDRLLLAIASTNNLSDIKLELSRGREVVMPYVALGVGVRPGGLAIKNINLERKVTATESAWSRHHLKQHEQAAPDTAGPFVPLVVSRFFAVRK